MLAAEAVHHTIAAAVLVVLVVVVMVQPHKEAAHQEMGQLILEAVVAVAGILILATVLADLVVLELLSLVHPFLQHLQQDHLQYQP
jgi:hypothetical protein